MKNITKLVLTTILFSTTAFGQPNVVKKSNSGICHAPGTHYYNQTKHYTPYKTLDECLKSGGRLPKR